MTFARFFRWCVEKFVELNLAVAALLVVKFFMPTSPQSFVSLQAFLHGVSETWRGSVDDASYMSQTYMDGSYLDYALRTYLAAAYVIGFYFYLSSLYIFISLFIAMVSHKNYTRRALMAYVVSCAVFALVWGQVADTESVCLVAALFVLGLGAVAISSRLGGARDKAVKGVKGAKRRRPAPQKTRSGGRRVSLDLGA